MSYSTVVAHDPSVRFADTSPRKAWGGSTSEALAPSMKRATRVNDESLTRHRVRSTHRNDLVGAVVLVGGLAQQRTLAAGLDLLWSQVRRRARAFKQAGCDAVHQ